MSIEVYETYSDTEYVWLPTVPKHWERIPMRAIVNLSDVRNKQRNNLELLSVYREYGIIPKSSRNDNHNVESENLSNYKYVGCNYLVMNKMKMWQGSLGVSNYEGIVSPAYIVCRIIKDLNTKYLHYLLRTPQFKVHYNRYSKGIRVGQWDFSYDDFKTLYAYLPPQEEQDQIVRFLDWKTSEMTRFIKEKKQEIERLTELKNSMILKAVFRGLTNEVETKPSISDWIGKIPQHWEELMLFQCAKAQSVSNKEVHHQNLLSLSYGKIIRKDINTTSGLLPASYDTYQIIDDGNIVLRLTDLQNDQKSLRVGIATETGIITSAYTTLRTRSNILPEYLYLLLHSYDVSKVFYGMGGGVRQSIGYPDIRRMFILVPPIDEQKKIIEHCYEQQSKIEQLILNIKEEITHVQELRTKTISDVVTGAVNVQDVNVPDYKSEVDDELESEEELEEVNEEVDE